MENYPVKEQVLMKEDALQMEECFVTNSLMGVMPVNSLEKKTYSRGPAVQACFERYHALAGSVSSC